MSGYSSLKWFLLQLPDQTWGFFPFYVFAWSRKWQPTPVFLPGESHGTEAWQAADHRVAKSWIWPKWLSVHSMLWLHCVACGNLVPWPRIPRPYSGSSKSEPLDVSSWLLPYLPFSLPQTLITPLQCALLCDREKTILPTDLNHILISEPPGYWDNCRSLTCLTEGNMYNLN